ELLRVQPIQPALPSLVNGNQTHLSQHTQMLGNSRLRKTELAHQFTHIALRSQGEQVHNLSPARFGDSVEDVGGCCGASHAGIIFRYGNMSSEKNIASAGRLAITP